jgi:protein TonB
MFEQAIITEHRRPWTLALSFTLQTAAAGAVVLLSIITIDKLPNVNLPLPLPPLPAAPRAVELVETPRSARGAISQTNVFTAPVRIPARIADIVDDVPAGAAMPAIEGIVGTGLPPGLYSGTPLFRSDQLPRPAPPPPGPADVSLSAPAKPTRVIQVGGNVMEAMIIRRVIPEYPRLARDMRLSGTVRLVGIISREGTVRELKAIEGHPLLVKAAVAAVMQWLYRPTLLNGEPVDVAAPIEVRFTLQQ